MTNNSIPQPDERDRASTALALRIEGQPYRVIAEHLGYRDESGARKAVDRLLTRIEHERVDELRQIEGQRLDALMAGHWDAALAGDVDAARVVLGVIDRRAKLFGLNAPTAVAVGVGQITDREFAEQAAELIAGLRPDMARELRGAVPPVHDASRTAVPEGYDTREPVSSASVAHSAETTNEPEPWADVDDPAPVPRREAVPEPAVEPDPEPEPAPAPRPVNAPPTGGYMQRLSGNRPSTVVFNAP
ncbi:hypothetical protein GPOL_c32270 [Gordonia polyisoprenivorans VH2]|uniref:Uncharacterized protein n=1 Tax=Gordonia polyisoprenivorans (strain DSM 44266 / VH2) TaxID=1112204 RepID=H6MXC3_GORPV|nr:hypothetical protein [Gordonia polyisoprenivorans]AFA74241.1 hypothetical protein GPOL_c32270 [Gordonia polyisoprenivorans VH2]